MLIEKMIIGRLCDADRDKGNAGELVPIGTLIDLYEKGVKPYEADNSAWNAYVNGTATC